MWWWISSALAGAMPVVAIGDGMVAEGSPAAAPGGWVAVLQDCLDERAPGRYSLVDRASGNAAFAAFKHPDSVRDLVPDSVIVAFGAKSLDGVTPAALEKDITKLIRALRVGPMPPEIVLVGLVRPTAATPVEQAHMDEQVAAWNTVIMSAGGPETAGVRRVDLLGEWPTEPGARSALSAGPWALSDQGHARVAAAVCDAVLADRTPVPVDPVPVPVAPVAAPSRPKP